MLVSFFSIAVTVFVANLGQSFLKQLSQRIGEERRKLLKEDIENMLKKYHELNSPATFAECAKIQREIVKKKKELTEYEEKLHNSKIIRTITFIQFFLKFIKYIVVPGFLIIYWWDTPAITFDFDYVYPLGAFTYAARQTFPPYSVSIILWVFLSYAFIEGRLWR